jgi:3-dehydroquinate dehydratase-1
MAQLVFSGNLLASPTPLVVGVISTAESLRASAAAPPGEADCDLVELRLDSIQLPAAEVREMAAALKRPLLFTARHPDEGGQGNLDAGQRTKMLEGNLDLAALIDIELRSALDMQGLIRKAQAKGVQILGSFHDFNLTPSPDILNGAIEMGIQFRLNAVKLATTLRGPADLATLINILAAPRRLPLSVMGMGALGRASRLALAHSGSILNYGFLGASNAPGQWPARRLREMIHEAAA